MQRIKDDAKDISHALQWERVQGDSCVSGSDDVRMEALLARVSNTSSGEDFGMELDEYKPTLKRCWGDKDMRMKIVERSRMEKGISEYLKRGHVCT